MSHSKVVVQLRPNSELLSSSSNPHRPAHHHVVPGGGIIAHWMQTNTARSTSNSRTSLRQVEVNKGKQTTGKEEGGVLSSSNSSLLHVSNERKRENVDPATPQVKQRRR
eukprot:PhF_6_TR4303/c0_g1_i2/m.5807